MPGRLRRFLDRRAAAENDQVRQRNLLPLPDWLRALNSFWIPSSFCSTFASSAGWLTSQSFCGARRMRAPFAPPRLSEPRNVDADAQAVETSCETDRPDARIFAFRASNVLLPDQRMIHGGDRVLPRQLLLRNERAEIAHDRDPYRGASA